MFYLQWLHLNSAKSHLFEMEGEAHCVVCFAYPALLLLNVFLKGKSQMFEILTPIREVIGLVC